MAQTEARPVPAKRTDLVKKVDTSLKTQLVQSFVGFNYATVTDHHMQLARTCIEQIKLRDARYDYVPFTMVIQWNEVCYSHYILFYSCSKPVYFPCDRINQTV